MTALRKVSASMVGFIGVLGGVASISLWIAPSWSPGAFLRSTAVWALRGAGAVLAFGIPVWAIIALALVAVLVVRFASQAKESPVDPPPAWHSYTSDELFGVRWEWRGRDGEGLGGAAVGGARGGSDGRGA